MSALDDFRMKNPGAASLSDAELIGRISGATGIDPGTVAADFGVQINDPGFVSTLKRSGAQMVGGVGEIYGDVTGNRNNALSNWADNVAFRNPSGINSLADVAENPWLAAKEAVGNAATFLVPGAGLKIAGNVARGAKMLNTARALDNPLTQAAVAGLPSLSEIGESQRESGQPENYALKYLGAGAVGAIENLGGVQRMMGLGRAPQVLSKADEVAQFGATPWRTVGKTMLRSGVEEGLEEIPQTFIEKGAGYQDPFSEKNLEEAALGGVMGTIGGGVLGAGHGAARGLRHAQIRRDQSVDLLAQGADLGRISDQAQWAQAFMNKAGENGDAWFDQRMNSINQQRLGEAVQNNFTAGLGSVALEDSAMQGPFRTPVDELLWNRQREIAAAQRANLGTTPDMFGGEDSYGYIGESSPVDYGPAVNRDRKQMSLDFNPPEAPPPVLYGNQNQPYVESFNNSREGKFNPSLNSRATGSPMTGAFTQLPIGETGAQVINRLPTSQQVNESVSHPMFPMPTDVGSALATLQQALGQKTPVIEGTPQHSAILAASQILARAGVKLPKGGRATQTQPVAAQAAATTQQKAQPKPAAAPAAKVTQPRGKFSQEFQAKLEAAVAEGKVAPDDPIVTDWHASKKLKADAQSFGQALDDKLAGPTVLPMTAEQALQTKAKNAVAEVKAGGLNLTMKQIPVFNHLQKAFAENRVDDVLGADGKWKYNEIGTALGLARGSVESFVNGVAKRIAEAQGVSVDEMKAALKARTAEVRTTEMSEKDKLGLSPKQQSSVFNEEDLFGNENGAEQNAEVINTVGGSQSAVGTNEAPTDLVVSRPDAPEVVANKLQSTNETTVLTAMVEEARDVAGKFAEEAQSTWNEYAESSKPVGVPFNSIPLKRQLAWLQEYAQLIEEKGDLPWAQLEPLITELYHEYSNDLGSTNGQEQIAATRGSERTGIEGNVAGTENQVARLEGPRSEVTGKSEPATTEGQPLSNEAAGRSDTEGQAGEVTPLHHRSLKFTDESGVVYEDTVVPLDEAKYPRIAGFLDELRGGQLGGVFANVEGFFVSANGDNYAYKNPDGSFVIALSEDIMADPDDNFVRGVIAHELGHVADNADSRSGGKNSSGPLMGVMVQRAKALFLKLDKSHPLKEFLAYPFSSFFEESKSPKLLRVELYAQLVAAVHNPEVAAMLKQESPALYNFAEMIVNEIEEEYSDQKQTRRQVSVDNAQVVSQQPAPVFSRAAEARGRISSGTFSKIGEKLDELVSDPRQFFSELKLGFTTLEQIAEATKSAAVQAYSKAMVAMQMKEKDIVHKASQIDLKWAELAKDAAVFKRLNSVMTESTLAEYDPSKTKPTNERERAIYQDWNLLPKEAKDQYVAVRKFYEDNLELRKSFMEDLEKKAKLQGKELDQFRQWYAKVKGPYFPLVRIGDYYAVGMSKRAAELMDKKRDGLLSSAEEAELSKLRKDPKHYTTSSFNSLREAKKWAKDNAGAYHTTRFNKSEEKFTMGDLNLPGLPQLEAYINAEMPAEIRGEVRDMIAKLAFEMAPEGSHLKRMMNREGVAGYEQDMRKAFAASSISQAHYISRLMHNQDVSAALQEVRNEGRDDLNMRNVYNELVKRAKLASTPDTTGKIVTGLTNVSYLAHLGLSPAFVLTNMTQVPMITTPWLGARHGFTRTASEIAKAYGEAFNIINTSYKEGGYQTDLHWGKLFKPGSDIDKMLTTLRDRNVLEITMEHDLGVVANMGGTSKLSDVNKMLNTPVRATEYANRVVTALAAYRLAIADKKSHDEAVEHAAKAVSQTQLNYSELNAPRLMRTVLGSKSLAKVVFQFRKYQQGMLWLVASNVGKAFAKQPDLKGDALKSWQQERSEARRFTLGIFGLMQLMAGTTGLPFISSIGFLANMVASVPGFGDDDDPWDWETELRNFYHDAFGKEVGDVLSKGILMGVGLDMSTRIGMGNLASPLPFARSGNNGRETVGNVLTAAGGAPVGTIVDTIDGLKLLASGDGAKAAEKLVPLKAAKDMLKGYRYADEGMTDTRGNVVLPPEKFNAWDIAMRSTGFTPEIESTYYAANEAVQSAKFAASDKRHKLIQAYSRATLDGEDVNDIREKIAAFNERHPEKGVRIDHSALIKSTQAMRKLAAGRNDAGIRDDKATAPFMDRARFATE